MNPLHIWVVSLENKTTRTELKPPTAGGHLPAQFICFSGIGIILEVPTRTCAQGHKIQLQLDVGRGEKLIHFPVVAEVLEISPSQGQRDCVTFQFVGYEKTDWDWIQAAYRARQDSVSELFEKLRG
ncbi:MAG TPA: hypothetical protein VM598_02340 [Bdellovibrionota bacterium]|nr:hypothetical protein [Bdellovibrionota bacterium]